MSLEERRSALESARRALDGFESVLYQAPSAELAGLMAWLMPSPRRRGRHGWQSRWRR